MRFHVSSSIYAHIDCNSFYASCEIYRDPGLKGKHLCIGDQIVLTASYEAKRYGIHVGTPMWEAERILGKKFIQKIPDHGFYANLSARLMTYLREKLGSIEVFSIDEVFSDITRIASEDFGVFAESLKDEIYQDIGLPVSVGISNTRIKAKMLGDLHKPFGSYVEFDREGFEAVLRSLSLREIPYIGRGSVKRLGSTYGSAYDFYAMSPMKIQEVLGKNGFMLWLELHGVDNWKPRNTGKARKSIIASRSFNHNMTPRRDSLWKHLMENFERAYETLISEKLESRSIGIMLRDKEMRRTRGYAEVSSGTIERNLLLDRARDIFDTLYNPLNIYRSTGIYFGELLPYTPRQISLFDMKDCTHIKNEKLEETLIRLRNRYGKGILKNGFIGKKEEKVLPVLYEVK